MLILRLFLLNSPSTIFIVLGILFLFYVSFNVCFAEGVEDLPVAMEFTDLHLTDNFRQAREALKGLSGIYCVKNLYSGAMYIGSSVDLSVRIMEHLVYGKSNVHLQNALSYYGLENFVFYIIEFVTDKSMLSVREQHYLDILFTLPAAMVYNFAKDVVNPILGRTHTEETKAKISESLKGENNPIYGRTGKVPKNAISVNIYYANNNSFVCSFSSQTAAAKWLGVHRAIVYRSIRSGMAIKGKYVIRSSLNELK